MNDKFPAINNDQDEFTINTQESDYNNLIKRLKEISKTIVLLETTIPR